jgi:UDP-glucose 4-epimerase
MNNKKILIVGNKGFISRELYLLFQNNNYNVYNSSREELDFLKEETVTKYFKNNSFNYLIFTPVFGGRRTIQDTKEMVYKNILMHQNLLKIKDKFEIIFYFGSGAVFDRETDILNKDNRDLGLSIPVDPYGLSKLSIENEIRNYSNFVNLRIFNCFGMTEVHNRMIKGNILNYINNKDIIIHQDKYFDFLFMEDMFKLIKNYIDDNSTLKQNKEINTVYDKKLKLSDIASHINNLDEHKVNIEVLDKSSANSYSGSYNFKGNIHFLGLEYGLKKMYNYLLHLHNFDLSIIIKECDLLVIRKDISFDKNKYKCKIIEYDYNLEEILVTQLNNKILVISSNIEDYYESMTYLVYFCAYNTDNIKEFENINCIKINN